VSGLGRFLKHQPFLDPAVEAERLLPSWAVGATAEVRAELRDHLITVAGAWNQALMPIDPSLRPAELRRREAALEQLRRPELADRRALLLHAAFSGAAGALDTEAFTLARAVVDGALSAQFAALDGQHLLNRIERWAGRLAELQEHARAELAAKLETAREDARFLVEGGAMSFRVRQYAAAVPAKR
jgi:hypothetical protein